MKKYIIGIAFILGFIIGFSVLLYPMVAEYFNSKSQSRAVAQYFDNVAATDDTQLKAILASAQEYNKNLLGKENRFEITEADTVEYNKQIDNCHGVMGVLVIDKINVKLAIYHGTDAGVLQVGVGHLQGTSLPVGGVGTHTVITGHRGVPSATLLTDLDKLVKDDTFTLYVLGETLTYQVDDIKTVEPQDVEDVGIDPNMDYCTLVTCTPYGINTHRLLVRGHRIETAANVSWDTMRADAQRPDEIIIILIFIVPVLPVLMIYFTIKCVQIRNGGKVKR